MSKTDNNNIYDINDIHNEEELTDEMLQAYLDNVDVETPDLWERIEAGFDAEIENSADAKKNSTKGNTRGRQGLRRYAGLVAAIVVCAIVIPVAMLSSNNKNTKNDNATYDSDIIEAQESAEMADESMNMLPESADMADESMDMMPESADMTDDIAGDIQQADSALNQNSASSDSIKDDDAYNSETSTLLVTLEYVTADNGTENVLATVHKVISDSEDVKLLEEGDVITFINQDEFEEMYKAYNKKTDGEYEIAVTDVTESGNGSYVARFVGFK